MYLGGLKHENDSSGVMGRLGIGVLTVGSAWASDAWVIIVRAWDPPILLMISAYARSILTLSIERSSIHKLLCMMWVSSGVSSIFSETYVSTKWMFTTTFECWFLTNHKTYVQNLQHFFNRPNLNQLKSANKKLISYLFSWSWFEWKSYQTWQISMRLTC